MPTPANDNIHSDLIDFARNVAGLDDHVLRTADAGLLRATIHEYRARAREILDRHPVDAA